jgi:hypothetical protein
MKGGLSIQGIHADWLVSGTVGVLTSIGCVIDTEISASTYVTRREDGRVATVGRETAGSSSRASFIWDAVSLDTILCVSAGGTLGAAGHERNFVSGKADAERACGVASLVHSSICGSVLASVFEVAATSSTKFSSQCSRGQKE